MMMGWMQTKQRVQHEQEAGVALPELMSNNSNPPPHDAATHHDHDGLGVYDNDYDAKDKNARYFWARPPERKRRPV